MGIPKYRILADELEKRIVSGEFRMDEKLCTEDELVTAHHVSRQTVRQALDVLSEKGLVYRRQGSGTYVGRSRRRMPSGRVCVITMYINDYIFPSLLRGMEKEFTRNGYIMELASSQNRVQTERRLLLEFSTKPVDGLIVEGVKTALPNPNVDLYRQFALKGIPVVFINGAYPDLPGAVSVMTDDFGGGKALTEYLISRGMKNIGGVFQSDDIQGMLRYSGYMRTCAEYGLPLNDDAVVWYNMENYVDFLDRYSVEPMLSKFAGQDAIVCFNDLIASKLQAFFDRFHAGERPFLASFDDNVSIGGRFATLAHPKEEMGVKAAETLLSILRGQPVRSIVMPWGALHEQ